MTCSSGCAISYVRTGVPLKVSPAVLKGVEVVTEIQEALPRKLFLGTISSFTAKHRLEAPHSFLKQLSQEPLRVWLSQAHRNSSLQAQEYPFFHRAPQREVDIHVKDHMWSR